MFRQEYALTKPADMRKLSAKLFKLAGESGNAPAARFVLLAESRDLATKAGELSVALAAVEQLRAAYAVDALAMRSDVLRMGVRAVPPPQRGQAAQLVSVTLDSCLAADRYDLAERLVEAALAASIQAASPKPAVDLRDASSRIRRLRVRFGEVVKSLERLKVAPDDHQANRLAGTWHCLVKGEWNTGLPELLKSGEAELESLAASERDQPQESGRRVELADGWCLYASRADVSDRDACLARATFWYRAALAGLSGLERHDIEQRLVAIAARSAKPMPHQLKLDISPGVSIEFVLIAAGDFSMGGGSSPEGTAAVFAGQSAWYACEYPRHTVTISKPFYLGRFEVTQQQWQALLGSNPASVKDPLKPVEMLSWDDAQAFCAALSQRSGRQVRLPTEAEWEYACRAGSAAEFPFGDSAEVLVRYAWFGVNSNQQSHAVGQKLPNAWGLHDLLGNVGEWCQDVYAPYAAAPVQDPHGPVSGTQRVVRGGSWPAPAGLVRPAHRWPSPAGTRTPSIGLRVVVEPE